MQLGLGQVFILERGKRRRGIQLGTYNRVVELFLGRGK
jgi:hypothetical protein